jgi:hypothetical protein
MSSTPDDPGAGYPPECSALMERTMQCVVAGDIPGAVKLAGQVSECLVRNGYDEPPQLPDEYYMLMHKSIMANRAGDYAEVERMRAQMDELEAAALGDELWGDEEPLVSAIPADCMEAIQGYMAALNSGEWAEARRIAAELQQAMEERGLPPLPLLPPNDDGTFE